MANPFDERNNHAMKIPSPVFQKLLSQRKTKVRREINVESEVSVIILNNYNTLTFILWQSPFRSILINKDKYYKAHKSNQRPPRDGQYIVVHMNHLFNH